ncbi:hypothetical protein PJ267_05860 [Arthrobacter sp. OVS8]|nr:hypothetical protein PJ267_05860 [Arthrobacter sp. OVS8]
MSTHLESSTKKGRSVVYIVSVILLVVLAVIALMTFRSARETQQSLEKADQLIASINEAGGRRPRVSRSPGCLATTAVRSARTRTTR